MSYNPVPSLNNGNATFNNELNVSGVSTFDAGVKTKLNSESDGATITFDMDQSNTHSTILGGNRTLAVSNVDAGQKFTLRIAQDSTGEREVSWWGNINWIISSSGEPTLNSGINEVDYFGFLCTSGGYYDGFHMTELGTGGGGGGGTTYNIASGLPYSSGEYYLQEINQNAADIVTVSGLIGTGGGTGSGLPYSSGDYYLQEIRTNSASGVSISGTLQPQITQNSSDIVVVSGLIGGGGGGGLPYSSGEYYLNSINTVSGLIPNSTFNITAGDGSNYTIDGMGLNSASDPTIYVQKGHTYKFNKTFSGHPFAVSATDGGSVYSDADGNNIEIGSSAGSVTFEVPQNAPDKLYYYCTAHPSNMKGVIYTTTDGSTSGYFESRVDSADSSITANSGYFESRVDTNAADIITVSGLTGGGGGGTTYTAGSGLSLVDTEFNVYGGSGNFEYIELQTDNTVVPKLKFTGSGVTDTPITLEVRSSYESVSESGSALLFQGSQGQLFSITDNLSSGVIFSVADIAGLPMLEVDASGHVHIGEYADDITAYKPILLSGGVPTSTTNKLYNDAGTLYFNGSSLGGGGGLPYTSGDYYLQEIRSNSVSGVAISGYFESRVDSADSDIAIVSGLLYDDTAISGYFESRVDGADSDIATVSGLLYDDTAVSGYFESRVDLADSSITANSGYFESRVDTNAADIITVSGLTGGGGGGAVSAVANGADNRVVTFSSTDALNGEANLTFDGSTLAVNGAFTATTKSFLIDHPTKGGMKLQYASLEGPENGVYVRGTNGSNIITLPDYWSTLVDQSTVTVSLTPIGYYQALYVEEKGKNYIKVGGAKGSYDYVIYGERKDVEKLKVEW